ncbi:type IX secretion system membrane protein PorP/SprF [Hymenobacter sp. BT664]|uniref:Type IX secretion system membrane protein PorP/SprF n=1 Tax=Hymenobacter montanus TaxID=2771359 RepID=A0A927BBV9_9BACT|nr:type IX secretion system membrane protein PorP/SprF [Hymenobacter montanus]MBD2767237.1 type IX secretion system membrane protein PorP/SprF [Hymenobacter montanus]
MKHFLCLALVLLAWGAGHSASAQQLAQLSQYMNNNFLINPAVAGTEDFVDIKVSNRTQWVGLEGAPRTYYASIHTALAEKRRRRSLRQRRRIFNAVGGLLYADVTGATSRTGAYFSYAHNVALTPRLRVGLGMSAGVQQFAIDGQQLHFHEPNPSSGSVAEFVPDATVGVWLYGPSFYVGVSAAQLLNSSLNASFQQAGAASQANGLQPHYFLTGGLRIPLTPNWVVVPSALVKVTSTAPAAVDLTLRVRYLKVIWAGASLRLGDAVAGMVGVNVSPTTSLTYSYDMGISSLNPYHSGSHEVLLGFRIKRKIRVRDNRFW